MKKRAVIFSPEARDDLYDIEARLQEVASASTTEAYIARILDACNALDIASERGHSRDDLRPGTRIFGFERRLTIAFAVRSDRVDILRIFRAGRDWETEFEDE